jgi:hypothetical protein
MVDLPSQPLGDMDPKFQKIALETGELTYGLPGTRTREKLLLNVANDVYWEHFRKGCHCLRTCRGGCVARYAVPRVGKKVMMRLQTTSCLFHGVSPESQVSLPAPSIGEVPAEVEAVQSCVSHEPLRGGSSYQGSDPNPPGDSSKRVEDEGERRQTSSPVRRADRRPETA